jgi:(1->4)-alpha-D-glucan 1-alpha-D-glucosylmutase
MLAPPARIPLSTYRIQFTREFSFERAREIIPYLADLGITELYASPIFQASSSSTHGYDVNDYNTVSSALGGRQGLELLSAELRRNRLGLLVDFVPNHMGIDGEYNSWWRHVLEHGAQSKYAPYFDIEWHPRLERLNDRVLVPMLEDHYGGVLESGRISLAYEGARFVIRHKNLKLPIRPQSYRFIFDKIDEQLPSGDSRKGQLRELGESFETLDHHDPEARDRQFDELRKKWAETLAADPTLRKLLDSVTAEFNGQPGKSASFIALHELLENQHYRLAHWKVGAHEVNYRRFFAVDTLVGLKMENQEVFDATHHLLAELIASNVVTSIRLDHIDGLWNPVEYLERLAALVEKVQPASAPIWTLVEKILAKEEYLPEAWPVHGTTGYEFAAGLIDLFVDRRDEPAWTRIYREFTGETENSRDLTYQDKLFALEEIFPNAVNNLAMELDALIEVDWHKRDFSLHDLKTALRHLLASLSVYRTYRMPDQEISSYEKQCILNAVNDGIRRNPCVDPEPIRFVGAVLTGEYPSKDFSPELRVALERWVCKLQQATGAVMAKSVEDTHFYRYVRMFGANEVGSHPSRFGAPVGDFHRSNSQRLERTPFCMLTTSTHDTKLSEDARARLFALAEFPEEWERHLHEWHDINAGARKEIDGKLAPDAREEYLLYQVLLAAWPLKAAVADADFRQRIQSYFRKAQGEAKRNTAWTYPHEAWHAAGDAFVSAVLDSKEFMTSFLPFANRIAECGMIFSLAQTVLRLTSPGVPDLYQGNEVWDFSLVDPDNRRPIDFKSRIQLLDGLASRSPRDLMAKWHDGGIKMHVIRSLLLLRRELPDLFIRGDYTPLSLSGDGAECMVAFRRRFGSRELLVVVPRRVGSDSKLSGGPDASNTQLSVEGDREWKNVFTGKGIRQQGGSISVDQIFDELPVAVLIAQ